MKKLLSMFFVMLLAFCCVVVASCNDKPVDPVDPTDPTEELSKGMTNAKKYIQALYKDKAELTPSNYDLLGEVTMSGVVYTVTWTVEITSGVADGVTMVKSEDGKTYTCTIKDKLTEDTPYVIKATITQGEEKCEVTFNHKAPQWRELTWNEFVATEDGQAVVVKGIVTAIISKNHNGNAYNCVYLQDLEEGGYYVYATEKDPVDEGVQVGMTIRVAGTRDTYSGTYEVASGSYEILDSTIKTITPVDLTEEFIKAESLKDASITKYQGMVATLKNVIVGDENEANKYYYFELGGKKTYIRISSSVCPLTTAEQEEFKTGHKSHLGWIANVTGVICLFDGNFYFYPVNIAPAIEYVSLPEKTDAEAIAFEKNALGIETLFEQEDQIIELPIKGTSYDKVAISWALKEANENVTLEDGKLTAKMLDEAYKFTLVATYTCGEASDSAEVEISVDAASTEKYVAKAVEGAVVGTYKLALYQAQLGKTLYADGTINESEYLATTEKAEKGADFVFAAVDGKEGEYTIKVGEQYLEAYENSNQKVRVHFVAEPTGSWKWNEESGVFTFELVACAKATNNAVYYIGTYNTNVAFSPSAIKYIQGENAEKVGVSQFPAYPSKILYAVETLSSAEEAVVGTYKLALYQAQLGKILYADGTINESEYLATTEKSDKAADFVVAAVDGKEGEYTIKVGEQYLEAYENSNQKVRVHFVAEPTGSWKWNEDSKVYTFELVACAKATNNAVYYIGTYNTNVAFSPSAIKYIQGENAEKVGVSQFPANMSNIVLVEAVFNAVKEATVGTFKLGLYQAQLDQTLYADGTINEGEFLATTDKYAKAADFVVAAIDGKEGEYTIKVGEQYLEAYENSNKKVRVHFVAEPTGSWKWNEESGVFTFELVACANSYNNAVYYLGTYNTNVAFSPSAIKYIQGENAEKVGVSQFPAGFGVRAAKVEEPIQEVQKANVVIDWADGTVGQGYTSPNWKQEGWITDKWEEFTDKMNCRQSPVTSTKVVNMCSGWSMEYRYTYSTGESLGLANKLVMVLGNYWNNPEAFAFRVYAHDKDGNVVYLVGTADAFVDYPVTADVETVTYTFDEVELMDLIIDCKSKKNDNAFLYCGGIQLTYAAADDAKVAEEKKALTVAKNCRGELDLAVAGATYNDVAISWALKEANANVTIDAGKLTAVQGEEAYKVTLVATITCGEVTDTVEYEVTVKALVNGPYAVLDPSKKTDKHSAYIDTWTYDEWKISGGANNNGDWALFKFGPKSANIPANQDFYAATADALLKDATSVEVVIGGGSVSACYNQDSEKCEIYIECYEDAAMTKKIGEATESQMAPAIAKNGENQTLTFTGNWAKGTYIKVVFKITNTTSYNGVTCVQKIEIK